jgi:hypothetical protein
MKRFAGARFCCQSFDGQNRRAVCLHGEKQAGTGGLAVKKNRTTAAYSLLAAQMSAGETKLIAQEISQRHTRLDEPRVGFAIDDDFNTAFSCHDGRLVERSLRKLLGNPDSDIYLAKTPRAQSSE